MYATVSPTNDAGNGLLNTWVGSVLDDYKYTSNSGTRTLHFGDLVRVADDFADPDIAGQVFQWMGTAAYQVDLSTGIPTSGAFSTSAGYDDFELWKVLTPTDLINGSVAYAALNEIGTVLKKEGLTGSSNSYYGLIDHNDVRTTVEAYIQSSIVNVAGDVSVVATDAARISATEDSFVTPWDGVGGVIAVNGVLSSADAWLKDTPVFALGDLTVDAEHLAQIDASSTSRIEAWDALSAVVAFNAIGWIPVNIFFSAADILTSATDYFYDYTSNDEPATLDNGEKVRVDSGPHAGQVFEYKGTTQIGPGRADAGGAELRQLDAAGTNVTVTVSVVHDYTESSTPATVDKGKRVLIPGGTNGLLYQYVGDTPLTSPDLHAFDATNFPNGQHYGDPTLWLNVTPVFGGQLPSHAQALVVDSPLNVGGDVSVTATSGAQLNAMVGNDNVVAADLDLLFINAQTKEEKKKEQETKAKEEKPQAKDEHKKPAEGKDKAAEEEKKAGAEKPGSEKAAEEGKVGGYGASGAAGGIVLASNKVSSFARAEIIFTGAGQGDVTVGGTLNVAAQDTVGIDSHSSVVQDVEVSNTLAGLSTIVDQILLPNDYKYTTASGSQSLQFGDHVRLGSNYAGGGDTGELYKYIAAADHTALGGSGTQIETVTNGQTVRLGPLFKGLGHAGATYTYLGATAILRPQCRGLQRHEPLAGGLHRSRQRELQRHDPVGEARRRRPERPERPLPGDRQLHQLRRALDRHPDRLQRPADGRGGAGS